MIKVCGSTVIKNICLKLIGETIITQLILYVNYLIRKSRIYYVRI